jgi:hypothetical protein
MRTSTAAITSGILLLGWGFFVQFRLLRKYDEFAPVSWLPTSDPSKTQVSGRFDAFAPFHWNTAVEKKPSVVIVTAASHEKLVGDFQEIDNFYQKIWDNRNTYAEAHGNARLIRLI